MFFQLECTCLGDPTHQSKQPKKKNSPQICMLLPNVVFVLCVSFDLLLLLRRLAAAHERDEPA
jgi:hypothetical protein